MIHLSIGLPGRLAGWCDAVLARLFWLSGQSVTHIVLPGSPAPLLTMHAMPILNEAALSLVRSNATHAVVGARFPDQNLREALKERKAPFVLALDDPRLLVRDIMAETGATLAATTRAVANICPLIMAYRTLPNGLAVRASDAQDKGLAAIAAMARHFGISISEDQARALAEEMPFSTDSLPALEPEEQQTLDGALGAYAAHFAGAPLGDIIWTGALFSLAYDTARAPVGPVPMRESDEQDCLVNGPFMRLPPGDWLARPNLRVSAEGVGQTLIVDICSSRQLAAGKISPRNEETTTTEIPFTIDHATWRDIQVRFLAIRQRTPGQMFFSHVLFHPLELHPGG